MSLAGLEAAKSSDAASAEFYTSRLSGTSIERLEARIGRAIHVLGREGVEEDPEPMLEAAVGGTAVLLVAGDPMAATGHYGTACKGAPGETDAENARLLGKRVAELALKIHG